VNASGPDREASAQRWSFGEAVLDGRSLKLYVRSRAVELELKPLELLRHLLAHAGEAISKDDLVKAVWPGRVISDSALTSTVAKLRDALGEAGEAIKTVHGFGYRLEGDVRLADGSAPAATARDDAAQPSRRLAAIMFTDLVGYSALAHRDENLAIELLELHRIWVREVLPRHGGREIETVGDAFLIEFAGALAAVECALAIQRRFAEHNGAAPAARRMELRIGIHLGDVEHKDGKVMGDGVNIASRIHGEAQAGGVCVSESVYHATRNRGFGFGKLGERRLKNIDTPLRLYVLGSGPKRRVVLQKPWIGVAAAALLLTLGWAFTQHGLNPTTHAPGGAPIAILPCDNLSGDAALDLLSEGIAEEVSSRLSRIRELAIIGRASARAVRSKGLDARGIGRELDAAHVLTCSLRKPRDRVRLIAQLVETRSGVEIWSSTLDYQPGVTNDATAEIAVSVADALLPQLLGDERALLARHNTASTEALEAYLLGSKHADLYTPAWNARAIEAFERAVQLDPDFARAYAALAYTLLEQTDFEPQAAKDLRRRAITNAQRALTLDPDLAEAHAMMGVVAFEFPVDWTRARTELERALELNPNSVFANITMSAYLDNVGPFERASEFARKAVRLDPLNTAPHAALLRADFAARKYSQCANDGAAALALHPEQWDLHSRLADCLLAQGRLGEGLSAMRRAVELSGRPTWFLQTHLAYALALSGMSSYALELVDRALPQESVANYIYVVHAGLRNKDLTLAAMEADFARGSSGPYEIYNRPIMDFLRDDLRFVALGRKYGLKPGGTLLEPGP
jgi:adenylate cyclase